MADTTAPQPDPHWRTTDIHGHEHAYHQGPDPYPTLRQVESEPYPCDLCGKTHTDIWYKCRRCGGKVTPGVRPPPDDEPT